MKLIIIVLILFSGSIFAAEDNSPSTDWRFELNYVALAMREGTSPLVGPSAVYRYSSNWSFGVRTQMSLNGKADESLVALNLLQRFHLNSLKTSLFMEFSEAYNQTSRENYFHSLGTALGLDHQVDNYWSVGGLGGFEVDLGEDDTSYIYTKVSIFLALKM